MMPAPFHPAGGDWFASRFDALTPVQPEASEAVGARGTPDQRADRSGKALAAFPSVIDEIVRAAVEGRLADETAVVYVSPAARRARRKAVQPPCIAESPGSSGFLSTTTFVVASRKAEGASSQAASRVIKSPQASRGPDSLPGPDANSCESTG